MLTGTSQRQIEIRRPLNVFLGAALVLIYVYVMPYVGFYIASVVAVPLLLFNGGERRWLLLFLYTLAFFAFVYFCFLLLLGVLFLLGVMMLLFFVSIFTLLL